MGTLTNGNPKAAATTNRWAGKVTCVGTTAPWWSTSSVVGVAEIEIAGVLRMLVNVARGKNNGRWYGNPPSTKKGDAWLPLVEIVDAELGKEIEAVAVAAVQVVTAAAPVAAATVRTAVAAPPDDADLWG